MHLDSRPITGRDAAELARFLAKHELPLLHRVPFISRMLFQDMRRIEKGEPAKYIAFPKPTANPLEREKERMRRYYLAHRAELLVRARARHRAAREARKAIRELTAVG